MTRIADASNEDYLMMIAKRGSAWHVETLVSKYRRVKRAEAAEETDDLHALRSMDYFQRKRSRLKTMPLIACPPGKSRT